MYVIPWSVELIVVCALAVVSLPILSLLLRSWVRAEEPKELPVYETLGLMVALAVMVTLLLTSYRVPYDPPARPETKIDTISAEERASIATEQSRQTQQQNQQVQDDSRDLVDAFLQEAQERRNRQGHQADVVEVWARQAASGDAAAAAERLDNLARMLRLAANPNRSEDEDRALDAWMETTD